MNISQQPDLVLGENGVAFASWMTTATVDGTSTQVSQIASFNISSAAPNWTYQGASGSTLTIVATGSDGGISISDSQNGIVHLDTSGNPWPVSGTRGGVLTHTWTGQWFLQNSQGTSSVYLPIARAIPGKTIHETPTKRWETARMKKRCSIDLEWT